MPIAIIRSRIRRGKETFRILPAPWQFDARSFGSIADERNRWRAVLAGEDLMLAHALSKRQLRFRLDSIQAVKGRDILLKVQLVMHGGEVESQPLPAGYWAA